MFVNAYSTIIGCGVVLGELPSTEKGGHWWSRNPGKQWHQRDMSTTRRDDGGPLGRPGRPRQGYQIGSISGNGQKEMVSGIRTYCTATLPYFPADHQVGNQSTYCVINYPPPVPTYLLDYLASRVNFQRPSRRQLTLSL